jgi:integrase
MAAARREGVQERHQLRCASRESGRCNCTRSYRGAVYDRRTRRFAYSGWSRDSGAALKWRTQALRELDAQIASGQSPTAPSELLRDLWADWYAGAASGAISNRSGQRYKPLALDSYERAWRLHVEPALGDRRIATITRHELQAWVDAKAAAGMPRSTINNAVDPLRVLFRRALRRSVVATNPTTDLELPGRAEEPMRFASREEAKQLVEALPPEDRALWATALYGGLRRGELRALRWTDVDLEAVTMTLRSAWSGSAEGDPKSRAGRRRVPIVPTLAGYLRAHREVTGRGGEDLVFGRTSSDPFVPSTVRSRALSAWEDAELDPITLHQCRHTAASFMIAAGANAKALSVVMGHASIEITFNRYGHLMPGGEEQVGEILAAYLGPVGVI